MKRKVAQYVHRKVKCKVALVLKRERKCRPKRRKGERKSRPRARKGEGKCRSFLLNGVHIDERINIFVLKKVGMTSFLGFK